MRAQKDDLFDRRKVEVQQCMELKRTNSPIAFLCFKICTSFDVSDLEIHVKVD